NGISSPICEPLLVELLRLALHVELAVEVVPKLGRALEHREAPSSQLIQRQTACKRIGFEQSFERDHLERLGHRCRLELLEPGFRRVERAPLVSEVALARDESEPASML